MAELRELLHAQLLASLPDKDTIVMVNLVRFREHSLDSDGSGWDLTVVIVKLTCRCNEKSVARCCGPDAWR